MTKWGKRLFSIAFSFMFLFISIGYAQIADTLVINGTAAINDMELKGVVIVGISKVGGTGSSTGAGSVQGTANAKINVSGTSGQYVTYEITFKNYDTNVKYAFNAVKCTDSTLENNSYFNNGLTVSTVRSDGTTAAKGAPIEPGGELKILATYTIGDYLPASVSTILNYEFIVHVDSAGNFAAEQSLSRFDEILNSDKTYSAEEASALLEKTVTEPMTKMEILAEIMSTQGGGWGGTGYYVGNVAGSTDLHSSVLGELFEDDLALNIYDPTTGKTTSTEMTCLIKEQDVAGDNQKDMILYMTAETLNGKCNTSGWFTGYYENRLVTVYAVVFTLVGDEWVQLGDIYEGQANPNNYSGGGRNSDANSFRTDSWVSKAKTYSVTTALTGKNGTVLAAAYSYSVAANQSLSNLMDATDGSANTVFANLLYQADNVLSGKYGNMVGTAIDDLQALVNEAKTYMGSSLTQNANGTYTVSGKTRVEIEPYMKQLRLLLTPFENAIANNG